jgi:transglutaminase-like putative cysteine protease/predicted Zn-dependent protease
MLSTPQMLRRAFPAALVFALLTAPSARAAGEPWDGPAFAADPAALAHAASALPDSGSTGGIDVILLETVYSFDDAGRQTYSQRMIYRFTDGSAHESWSALEQSWAPWHQEKPVLRARVVAADGNGVTEHRLDPATITENAESQSSPDMFEDGRVLRAPLPATGAGSVVEEEVTVRETAPFFEGGTVDFANLQMAVPVRHVRLVLDAPAGLPLRWVARRLPGVAPAEQVAHGRRRLTFAVDNLPEYEEPEAGLPPETPRTAYVAFSTGESWGDLARRYSEIVDRTVRGADLSAFLRSASPQTAGSQVETINALLRKLGREIRYTGVELAEGGLIPRPPSETLKRKYGDCKDKAVVLTTLLRSLDIPAYVALLNAGEGDPDVEESLPGMGAFNHAIVMVPGNPAVWIDPTDPFSRAGELPVQDQGRLALVASPTATGLVRTPEASSADNREIETREIYLSDLGGARVVETTEYWGAEENDLRSSYADADKDDLREALEDYVSEAYLADKLTGLDYSEPDDLSHPFRLRLEASDASRGTTDVRDAAVAVFLSTFADRLPGEISGNAGNAEEGGGSEEEAAAEPGPRSNDYVFTRPFQIEVRYRIVPPAGFAPRPLPAYRSRQFGTAKLEEAYAVDPDGVVTATIRFDTGKRRISPAELEALRTGMRQLAEEKPVLIGFDQVGETHLAAGRVREALDEFRRLALLSPKKALPRTRIARALLAGGLGEAAREEAEQAVRIEPGLAYAWVTLGWIRQHDDLGRRFGSGYDRAGAIAAYRKAKALDPEDSEARGDLAILLEHDARGERYGPGADLAAAIEEYTAIQDDLEGMGLPNNLLIAYMWAQRFDDMKALLDKMDGTDGRAALKLVALAATEGTDAALRSAERAFTDGSARAEALSGAGRNLMLLRRYPEAAALFEAAGRQSSNAAALLGMAELLRKARRYEELTFAPKDPANTVKRLSTLAAGDVSGDAGREKYSALVSREMTGGLDAEARKSFWEGFESGFDEARRAARSANLPLSVAMDLGLAVLRPTVSGDDAVGYRVVMTSSVADRVRNVAFVIPEDGEYRIAATDKAIATVGKEALRRLDHNDLRGARQWLDWAYDEEVTRKGADPETVSPFLDLWSRGAEADAEQARCAAASLIAWDAMPSATLPTLTACRQAAAEGPRQAVLDRALLSAYRGLGQDSEAAETAERLQQTAPDSVYLYESRVAALLRLQRWDDARRAAETRLARLPDDLVAQQTLMNLALRKGDFDTAESILQRAADSGKADAEVYNEMAWLQLFRGKVDDRTVELAQRAATLSGYKSYDVLHTLAALYAEQGKTAEAYRLILQALEAKGGQPGDSDWYVFGRLAESYGLPDAARRCYEKAHPEDAGEPDPISSIHLVRRRLEALGAKPEPKRVASRP